MNESPAIIREALVYAVERQGKGAAGNVYHACWPTEFPLTVCGVIASEQRPRLANATRRRLGRDCEKCVELLATRIPMVRENPHRG